MPHITTRQINLETQKTNKILEQRTTKEDRLPPPVKPEERTPAKGPLITTHNIDSFSPADKEKQEKVKRILAGRTPIEEPKIEEKPAAVEEKVKEVKPRKKRGPYKRRKKK